MENTYKPITSPSYDWDAYHNGNPIQRWWKRRIAFEVSHLLNDSDKEHTYRSIIDVGCGSSPILSELYARNLKVGIDVDSAKVMFMRKQDQTSSYWHYDGYHIPFPDQHFEVAISIEVIEHLHEPENLIYQLSRVITKGGPVVIATPDFSTIRWNLIEKVYGLFPGYHCEHIAKFSESSLIALCKVYGLHHIETRRIAGCDMVCLFTKE